MDAAAIYTAHAPAIRRAIARLAPPDEVDDILADTFERFLRGMPAYEDRGFPITAWLYRIAHDRAIDVIRRRCRRHVVAFEEWSAMCDGPEQAVERREAQRWIRAQILAHLGGQQRAVVWLRFVEDRTLAETATRLGLSIGRVKTFQSRGIARLRAAIVAASTVQEPPRCVAPDCREEATRRGMCNSHYARAWYAQKKRQAGAAG